MKALGEKIREVRTSKDLSLRELARRIHRTAAFLSDIERGKRYPSDQVLKLIAQALGESFEELKEYDRRAPVDDLKRLAEKDPAYGFALRRVVDEKITSEDLLKFVEKRKKGEEGN